MPRPAGNAGPAALCNPFGATICVSSGSSASIPSWPEWPRWRLGETDTVWILRGSSFFRRLLVVVDRESLAICSVPPLVFDHGDWPKPPSSPGTGPQSHPNSGASTHRIHRLPRVATADPVSFFRIGLKCLSLNDVARLVQNIGLGGGP
jgi:hypothetical protein